MQNLIQAEKNLAIIGGLLMLFALGPWRPYPVVHAEHVPVHRREDRAYPHPAE